MRLSTKRCAVLTALVIGLIQDTPAVAQTFNGEVSVPFNELEDSSGGDFEHFVELDVPAPLGDAIYTLSDPGSQEVRVTWSSPNPPASHCSAWVGCLSRLPGTIN